MVQWLVLPASDYDILGSNPTGGGIQLMTVRCFIAQSLSLSSFHRLDMPASVAQLDVHLTGVQDAAGSTPVGSATFFRGD